MSDRLKELQHQRALAQEQLAWLDREIARENGAAPAPAPLPGQPAAPGPVVTPAMVTPAVPSAEEILARFHTPTDVTTRDVKKGCYLYFIFALGALLICAVGAYLIYVNLR
jgi:hypothetical protein